MNFSTVEEIIEYINKETDHQSIPKAELEKLNDRNKIPAIYTQEGKEELKIKGYFDRRYLWGRIGFVFNRFHCEGCTERKLICKKCRAVRTIIKSF